MTAEGRTYGRFARFLAVGIVAAIVNLASRVALSEIVFYEVAIVLAFVLGLTTAFLLNRRYVFFDAGNDRGRQYVRFTLVNLAALAQVWVISVAFARVILPAISWDWHPEFVAHAIGVGSPVLTSYYAHKWFTFRSA